MKMIIEFEYSDETLQMSAYDIANHFI